MVILTVIILDFSTIYIWTYKRYDKHPCHVYMGSTPGVMGVYPRGYGGEDDNDGDTTLCPCMCNKQFTRTHISESVFAF